MYTGEARGMADDFHCKVCRKEIDGCAPDGSPLWCEDCCPDHEYEYDRGRQGHFCKRCDQQAPYDWYDTE